MGYFTTTYSNGGAATTATYNPFTYRGYYYDTELEFYYLNSRYYDSNTGRFINADAFISTGQGLIGYNMYAYCGNNPIMYSDPSGTSFRDAWERAKTFFNDFVSFLQKFKNPDGSYSLYDGDRFRDVHPMHDQLFVITPSFQPFDIKEGKLGLGSLSADLVTLGWEWEHFDLSLLDLRHAEVGAQLDLKKGKVAYGAMASIWSPSVSVSAWGITVEVGAEVGSVGSFAKAQDNAISVGFAMVVGGTLCISWD